MILKPQDVLVMLKLVTLKQSSWSYNEVALSLGMSPSEVHAAVKRALAARLAIREGDRMLPSSRNMMEFIIYGLKYVFIPEKGELTRGIPTGYAAPPLEDFFPISSEPPPVWPDADGEVRGEAFSPLYKSVPKAARADRNLYELLVLVDAIRGGRAREREIAVKEIRKRLK
ncbi:MAG: hypothetical protein ABII68_05100 [Pseudomonadota bacterium]